MPLAAMQRDASLRCDHNGRRNDGIRDPRSALARFAYGDMLPTLFPAKSGFEL